MAPFFLPYKHPLFALSSNNLSIALSDYWSCDKAWSANHRHGQSMNRFSLGRDAAWENWILVVKIRRATGGCESLPEPLNWTY